MAVDFEFEHDAQTVYEALTDPDFLVDRCLALGELSAECDVEESEGVTTIRLPLQCFPQGQSRHTPGRQ
jgi:hypothetical protein